VALVPKCSDLLHLAAIDFSSKKWGISDQLASRFDNFPGTEAQSPLPPVRQFSLEAIFDRLLQTDLDSRMK
jgi:hypothetical protein